MVLAFNVVLRRVNMMRQKEHNGPRAPCTGVVWYDP